MAKFIIREANQDDLSGITRLRHTIKEFRSIETDEYRSLWNSLIYSNPCSIQKVLVAVNEANDIIAHYAIVPFKFMKNGELLLGGFLCQLMVHEEYRQELIFPRLEHTFLREYNKLGFDFVYVLGNRAEVINAHLSFGFRKIVDVSVYARPYKLSNITKHYINSKLLRGIIRPGLAVAEGIIRLRTPSVKNGLEVTEISKFDSDIDQLLAKVQSYFPLCGFRNAIILNWRFVDSPIPYEIYSIKESGATIAYIVIRRMQMKQFDVLAIVDILFSPKRFDVGKALLHIVHNKAVELGVDMSACLLNPHDPLCPILKKLGYFKTSELFSFIVHEPQNTSPHFEEESYDKWHLTWFDHDSV